MAGGKARPQLVRDEIGWLDFVAGAGVLVVRMLLVLPASFEAWRSQFVQ
jgi:hypothetical protein